MKRAVHPAAERTGSVAIHDPVNSTNPFRN